MISNLANKHVSYTSVPSNFLFNHMVSSYWIAPSSTPQLLLPLWDLYVMVYPLSTSFTLKMVIAMHIKSWNSLSIQFGKPWKLTNESKKNIQFTVSLIDNLQINDTNWNMNKGNTADNAKGKNRELSGSHVFLPIIFMREKCHIYIIKLSMSAIHFSW